MKNILKLLPLLALLAAPALAQAPATTAVTQNNRTSQCTSAQFVGGGGVGSPEACVAGGVAGPGSSTSGDLAIWNNTTGSLLKDQTLSATIDAAFSSTQGSILYRGASAWLALGPGTSGNVLTTQGSAANPTWSAVSGSSGCTVTGGSQFNILVNNGASGCSSDTNASANAGTLTLGASGTLGDVVMGNATSGTVTLEPVTGALGNVVASIPANTGTIAELNLAQLWAAVQTFPTTDLAIGGSSTGTTAIASANAGASNFTITLPAATGTVALVANANVASVSNSDGTLTISPTTGAVVASLALGHANTWTADQTVTNVYATQINDGTQSSGTYTLSAASYSHKLTLGGAFTLAINNWPSSGILGQVEIQCINCGLATLTWPTTNWLKGDGTVSTTFSSMGVTLQSSGTNTVIIWTTDGGTTLYGRAG